MYQLYFDMFSKIHYEEKIESLETINMSTEI